MATVWFGALALAWPATAGALTSTPIWQSQPFAPQTGMFEATFDLVPSALSTRAWVGLSRDPATGLNEPVLVRLNNQGWFDVRDPAGYGVDTMVPFAAGTTYHFRLAVDLTTRTYSVWVTPQGSSEVQLASAYGFHQVHAMETRLDHWALNHFAPSIDVTNFAITSLASDGAPPDGGPSLGDAMGSGDATRAGDAMGAGYRVRSTGCAAAGTGVGALCVFVLARRRRRGESGAR